MDTMDYDELSFDEPQVRWQSSQMSEVKALLEAKRPSKSRNLGNTPDEPIMIGTQPQESTPLLPLPTWPSLNPRSAPSRKRRPPPPRASSVPASSLGGDLQMMVRQFGEAVKERAAQCSANSTSMSASTSSLVEAVKERAAQCSSAGSSKSQLVDKVSKRAPLGRTGSGTVFKRSEVKAVISRTILEEEMKFVKDAPRKPVARSTTRVPPEKKPSPPRPTKAQPMPPPQRPKTLGMRAITSSQQPSPPTTSSRGFKVPFRNSPTPSLSQSSSSTMVSISSTSNDQEKTKKAKQDSDGDTSMRSEETETDPDSSYSWDADPEELCRIMSQYD